MSKMSELSQVIDELKECGKNLITIADSITEMFSSTEDVSETPEVPTVEPVLSFLDIRKKFVEKSRAGHTEALKELLEKYGAVKLSDVDPSKYSALIADVETIS